MNTESTTMRYAKEGYSYFESILDPKILTNFKATVETHFGLGLDKRVEIEHPDVCDFLPAARHLKENPELMIKAQQLLGTDQIRVWYDQLIVKPPEVGRESKWHQDLPYWPLDEPSVVTCWIPLHDVGPQSSCLRVMPGSHTWGNRRSIVPKSSQEVIRLGSEMQRYSFIGQPKELEMQCGDCSFHHSLTFHGATANRSDSYRIAYKILYLRNDSKFISDIFSRAVDKPPT